MNKVFIINNSGHDYSKAEKYGKLVYLTKGQVASYAANKSYREIADKMKDVTANDYILVTSLASLNCIAGWIIGYLRLPLNLLLYKDGKYIVRKMLPTLIYENEEVL